MKKKTDLKRGLSLLSQMSKDKEWATSDQAPSEAEEPTTSDTSIQAKNLTDIGAQNRFGQLESKIAEMDRKLNLIMGMLQEKHPIV